MILKHRDPRKRDIKELERLLRHRLSPKQRFSIEHEIYTIKKGERERRILHIISIFITWIQNVGSLSKTDLV